MAAPSGRIGLLAFGGDLPGAVLAANPRAHVLTFRGVPARVAASAEPHRFEALGAVLDDLRAAGVSRVVMAGGLARPPLDPAAFDQAMRALAPRLMAAMMQGDDAALGVIVAFFEEAGFEVAGPHEVVPGLTADAGLVAGPRPAEADLADAARARALLDTLGPLDVGQAAVVAGGLTLGIETLQGTDAMLRFVAETPAALRPAARGVLVKRPKPGQDFRVDMPAIGPATAEAAAAAGLAGIVVTAGRVLLIDRPALIAALEAHGLFLWAETP